MKTSRNRLLSIILSVIAAIAGIVSVLSYFQVKPFNEKEVAVETFVYKLFSLTNKSDSLSVYYKGKSIDNLWRIRLTLKNNGKKNIIGIGEADIVGNRLKFNLSNGYEIISYEMVQNDFIDSISIKNNQVYCYFRKWKSNEKIQLDILMQSEHITESPSIIFDERNFKSAVVKEKKYDVSEISSKESDFEWLTNLKIKYPHFVFTITKWLMYFFGVIFMAAPIAFIFQGIQSNLQYREWKRKKWKVFLKELDETDLTQEYKDLYKRKPYKVPDQYKHKFTSIPQEPDSFGLAVSLFIFSAYMAFGGLIIFLIAYNNM